MYTNSTAYALVQVRGPTVTYSSLKFRPLISSEENSFDVKGFYIRRGNDRYPFDGLPVSRVLNNAAYDDILYHTFEADEDERSPSHEIEFDIPDFDESHRLNFRCVERDEWPDYLCFEVEDEAGDWLPVHDVFLSDLLPESFVQTLEVSLVGMIDSHTIDMLPMAAE